MARYFFDFRSDGTLSADDEGLDLLDADAAHQQAVGALVEGFAISFWKGRKTNASLSRGETTSGAFCKSRRSWNPNFSESSDLSDATYLTALHDQTAHRLSHLR